jgi:GMP synthase (glutamine-hydrolysing)
MRPEDQASDSEFEAILRVGNLDKNQAHRIRLEKEEIPKIDLLDYTSIIAGGSPFDVGIPTHKKSQVQKRIEDFYELLFNQIVTDDFPFLGACSGMGLLGQYCGTKISGKYSEPVGSVSVTITEEGLKDPLLNGLPVNFKALVGHKEACDTVPAGAVLLVTSEACPVQMFRLKKNIYATQFHPEADSKEFVLRVNIYKESGYFPQEKVNKLIASLQNVSTPISEEILLRFVKKYK